MSSEDPEKPDTEDDLMFADDEDEQLCLSVPDVVKTESSPVVSSAPDVTQVNPEVTDESEIPKGGLGGVGSPPKIEEEDFLFVEADGDKEARIEDTTEGEYTAESRTGPSDFGARDDDLEGKEKEDISPKEDTSDGKQDKIDVKLNDKDFDDFGFPVLEVADTSPLNFEWNRQKCKLGKTGSFAFRKRPTRVAIRNKWDNEDSLFQDSTEPNKRSRTRSLSPEARKEEVSPAKEPKPRSPLAGAIKIPGLLDGLGKSKSFRERGQRLGGRDKENSTNQAPLFPIKPETVLKPSDKTVKESQNLSRARQTQDTPAADNSSTEKPRIPRISVRSKPPIPLPSEKPRFSLQEKSGEVAADREVSRPVPSKKVPPPVVPRKPVVSPRTKVSAGGTDSSASPPKYLMGISVLPPIFKPAAKKTDSDKETKDETDSAISSFALNPWDSSKSPTKAMDDANSPSKSMDVTKSSSKTMDVTTSPSKPMDISKSPKPMDISKSPSRTMDVSKSASQTMDVSISPSRTMDVSISPPRTMDISISPPGIMDVISPSRTMDVSKSPSKTLDTEELKPTNVDISKPKPSSEIPKSPDVKEQSELKPVSDDRERFFLNNRSSENETSNNSQVSSKSDSVSPSSNEDELKDTSRPRRSSVVHVEAPSISSKDKPTARKDRSSSIGSSAYTAIGFKLMSSTENTGIPAEPMEATMETKQDSPEKVKQDSPEKVETKQDSPEKVGMSTIEVSNNEVTSQRPRVSSFNKDDKDSTSITDKPIPVITKTVDNKKTESEELNKRMISLRRVSTEKATPKPASEKTDSSTEKTSPWGVQLKKIEKKSAK